LAHGANLVANQIVENHGVQAKEISEEQAHPVLGSSMEPSATTDPGESSLDRAPYSRPRSTPESESVSMTGGGGFRAQLDTR
jgi:hypothetical protein